MADIYNFSMSITDWRWKESDKVQLNGADFYLWRQYIELAVGDWKEEKYVSQLFVCAQIMTKCFRLNFGRKSAYILNKKWDLTLPSIWYQKRENR